MKRTLILILVLAACTSTKDITGKDRDMLFPTGRATIRTKKEPEPGPDGAEAAERERRWRVDIEIAATAGEGDFGARLLAGESIDINGTVLSGPTNLVADFRLIEASVAAKAGWQLDKVDLMGLFGVGYSNFDLKVTDAAGTTARAEESGIGPLVGFQVNWEPIKRVELYGRTTFLIVLADATSGQIEFGTGFAVTRNVFVFAGYRWWRYRHEVAFSNADDFDIRAGGFVFGLELRF